MRYQETFYDHVMKKLGHVDNALERLLPQAVVYYVPGLGDFMQEKAGKIIPSYVREKWPRIVPPYPIVWVDWGVDYEDARRTILGTLILRTEKEYEDDEGETQKGWSIHIFLMGFPGQMSDTVLLLDKDGGLAQPHQIRKNFKEEVGHRFFDATYDTSDLNFLDDPADETIPVFLNDTVDRHMKDLGFTTETLTNWMGIALLTPLKAMGMLCCKNVVTEDIEPPPKRVKRRAKHGRPALPTYKVLKVKGSRKDAYIGLGGSRSMSKEHTVGGHFKTFTDAAPLLGKWVGTYHWGHHNRGSKAKGKVHKQYEVEL